VNAELKLDITLLEYPATVRAVLFFGMLVLVLVRVISVFVVAPRS
jgi:hypothetical protein